MLVTAAQSLASLGARLRDSILTNAGVLGVLSPGPEDAQLLRRLFAPLTVEDLLGLRRFELLLRMPGADGRFDKSAAWSAHRRPARLPRRRR